MIARFKRVLGWNYPTMVCDWSRGGWVRRRRREVALEITRDLVVVSPAIVLVAVATMAFGDGALALYGGDPSLRVSGAGDAAILGGILLVVGAFHVVSLGLALALPMAAVEIVRDLIASNRKFRREQAAQREWLATREPEPGNFPESRPRQ